MENYNFILTEDNSVGLYSKIANDILHSKTGALKEAVEKFIIPSGVQNKLSKSESLNVLDICYGIGYNSKALLNIVKNKKILIDALETDSTLIMLSPFLKDGIDNDELKINLIYQLLKSFKFNDSSINNLYSLVNEYTTFFNQNITSAFKKMITSTYKLNHLDDLNTFLHNIYYKYISDSMEYCRFANKYENITISFYNDDARCSVQKLKNKYDVVFLDAYSPQKDPTLWTIDFLSLIKQRMNYDSVLVTYSKSTPVRSALIQLGFNVGKIYIDGVDMGTVASLNMNLVPENLTDYDFELYESRSGIPFKDEFLSLTPNEILKNRILEQNLSKKISHTALLKRFKK